MRAVIEASSIPGHIDPAIDNLIRNRELDATYDPNPWGYFSHHTMCSPIAQWVGNTPIGSVMKAAPEAFCLNAGGEMLSVVLTSRNPDEMEASYRRSFGEPSLFDQDLLLAKVQKVLSLAENVTLTELDFADLVGNPTGSFQALANAGWPIDVDVAAATIDQSLYRNR
jgi:hypothetical protein